MNDHPIKNLKDDKLGVRRFAEKIAENVESLLSQDNDGSTAIGIVAPWGYGKTTILNFIEKALSEKEGKKDRLIFDFNPWIYSKRSNLTSEYISTLENKLGKQNLKEVAEPVKRLGQALNPLFPTLSRSTILLLPIITNNPVIMIVTIVIFVLVVIIVWSQTVSPKNLEDCKDAINKSLKDKQVIVFIDDIDRLPADEVMDILRLIISICNFKNCIYVLAYDEKYVIKAIEEVCKNQEGREYLEKIVSFPYKLPEHSDKTLLGFLHTGLSQIVEDSHYEKLVNTDHCKSLLEKLVPLYLQTPRKIIRLLNAFNTSYVIAGTTLHWGDLLTLESIKLYNPETYEVIAKNKKLYLKTYQDLVSYNINKREHTNIEEQRKSLVSDCDIRELVELLLPHYRSIDHYEERRVSHDYFFDNYFNIELNNTVLTEKEIQILIQVLGEEPERFSEKLTSLTRENSIVFTNTLDTLIDRVPQMNDAQKNALLEWFFTSSDDYTDTKNEFSNYFVFSKMFSNLLIPVHQMRMVHLTEIEKKNKSEQFFKWLCRIKNSGTLALFIQEILKKNFNNFLNNLDLSEEEINDLKTLAIKQFKALIEDEASFQSEQPIPWGFLSVTENWEQPTNEEPYTRQWLERAKKYPSALSKLAIHYNRLEGLLSFPDITKQDVIEFLPDVIEYCNNHDPEKVPFMEQLLKEVKELTNNGSL
jgi:hypothetical protein